MKRQSITDELREAIRSSGLSCYRIWQESGVNKAALSRFMSGQRGLLLESVDRIAAVLGLHITHAPTVRDKDAKRSAESTRTKKTTSGTSKVSKRRGAAQDGRKRRSTKKGG